ncbi:MAG TPA: hypothetical protein VE860_05895, partial [Chthoniobacterales bacterium]|nr:hypothetical protein [Chthoniobacterales bacterium]
MNRLWSFPQPIELQGVLAVSRKLNFAPGLAGVLAKIGLVDEPLALQFLYPRLRELRDPFEIAGIREAVDRLLTAIDRGERVALYGDYDVDGVASVALLTRVLRACGATVETFLPHRL